MNKIIFYNKTRGEVIQFNEFIFSDVSTFINFTGKINIDFLQVEIKQLRAERSDFINLANDLRKMYNNERKYATFNPLDGNIIIDFELHKFGEIGIKCSVNNDTFSVNVNFKYMTDQSFLSELIREIESIV